MKTFVVIFLGIKFDTIEALTIGSARAELMCRCMQGEAYYPHIYTNFQLEEAEVGDIDIHDPRVSAMMD